ncbi:MAG: thiolase domain-containing protein [Dehalococcoidia bacterium]|nr:thiolase domain-containing protein [Dehalococcoidia bacterium]
MVSQKRDAAIVGIYEYPKRKAPGVTPLQIKADSALHALDDAGLSWKDVDALYDAQDGAGMSGLSLSEYFGFKPNVIDTTAVGGSSYEFHASHARRAIASGKAKVALLTYGSTAHSNAMAIGTGGGGMGGGAPSPLDNMQAPYGMTLIANYAMVARRHMHEYSTTPEDLARIAVATRAHAVRNPQAVQAMTDRSNGDWRDYRDDVVNSRMIADPLHLLDCCMVSDGGGAVVIASADVARDCKKKPAWIIGTGEATKYSENGGDLTTSAAVQSGPPAFAEAGIRPDEIDIAMIYDSFTITVMVMLEDLGFCRKGEGAQFVREHSLRWDSPLKPSLNTDGGGLSSNHPGMRGLFLLIEATRQLRGESTSQRNGAKLAVAHGNGGMLATSHTGGTIILAGD